MIGTLQVAGMGAPSGLPEDQHKNEEEDAGDLEEDNVAHSAEWLEEPAHAPREAPCSSACLPGCRLGPRGAPAFDGDRPGNVRVAGRLSAGGQPLAGHASCDAHPDPQHPPDGLRFHTRL